MINLEQGQTDLANDTIENGTGIRQIKQIKQIRTMISDLFSFVG